MSKIIIEVGSQMDGYTFGLSTQSWLELTEQVTDAKPAEGLLVGYKADKEFSNLTPESFRLVASLLTGLSTKRIEELGGCEFFAPRIEKVLYSTVPASSQVVHGQ